MPELVWGQPCLTNAVSGERELRTECYGLQPCPGTQGTPGHRKHPLLSTPPVLEQSSVTLS